MYDCILVILFICIFNLCTVNRIVLYYSKKKIEMYMYQYSKHINLIIKVQRMKP